MNGGMRNGDPLLGTGRQAEGTRRFYGIGLSRAQNLTVINSDGSCTHFSEFEVPVFQTEEFRVRLPEESAVDFRLGERG